MSASLKKCIVLLVLTALTSVFAVGCASAPKLSLANTMLMMGQRFAALWHAGQGGNAERVAYEVHEIEGEIKKIHKANKVKKGIELGPSAMQTLMPALEKTVVASKAGDKAGFESAYDEAREACNSCHDSTGYGFINIGRPSASPYVNQPWAPQP